MLATRPSTRAALGPRRKPEYHLPTPACLLATGATRGSSRANGLLQVGPVGLETDTRRMPNLPHPPLPSSATSNQVAHIGTYALPELCRR